MTAEAIRAAAANFHRCLERLWPAAARRRISRATYDAYTAHADARSAHHGSARQPAGIHQIVLGLSRSPGERRAHRTRAARCSQKYRATFDAVERSLWRRPLHHRRDLGRGDQLRHARRRAAGDALDRDACLHRPPAELFPRRIPLRAGNSPARRRASPTGWSAPGPAPSARPSSCRPRSSATPSTSTATAAATWSTRCPTSSPPPPTI